jgi:hypothetical protein
MMLYHRYLSIIVPSDAYYLHYATCVSINQPLVLLCLAISAAINMPFALRLALRRNSGRHLLRSSALGTQSLGSVVDGDNQGGLRRTKLTITDEQITTQYDTSIV